MDLDSRIQEINSLLIAIAEGNFKVKGASTEIMDPLDAIVSGINMIGEELQMSTVSRDYLRSIYRGIVDMLIVLNPDNTIQKVNESVCKLLLFNKKELLEKPFSILLPKNKLSSLNEIDNQLNSRGYCHDVETIFLAKNGKKIIVSCSCSLLYDNQNHVHGKLFIAKNITKIKKTEEQLVIKNADLNTFVYRASHDLKGPLASIMGLVNLAKKEKSIPALQTYIEYIEQSTKRLDTILLDLIEIARVSQTSLVNIAIDLKELVHGIVNSLAHLPESSNVIFKIDITQTKEFRGDLNLLRSVLQNLIDNAIKYKKDDIDNPFVSVKIIEMKKGVKIEISDNGVGVPNEMQQKIFKMFYRGDNKSTGSGLGLYIVKTSVEKMDGEISIKSKENEGATFKIFIPYRDL